MIRKEETYPDVDGLVRKVCLKIADRNLEDDGQPKGPATSTYYKYRYCCYRMRSVRTGESPPEELDDDLYRLRKVTVN